MIEISYFFALVVVFMACIRILHMNSRADFAEIIANGTNYVSHSIETLKQEGSKNSDNFVKQIMKHAPIFSKPYIPPLIWGRSGHLQTIIHSTLGRQKAPRGKGDSRHELLLSDGSTITFDIFHALEPMHRVSSFNSSENKSNDISLLVCPGIGNSSETVHLRTFCHHANSSGFRVAVLNHLGVIPSIPLTSPRIFNYGSTEEYDAMVKEVRRLYPQTKLIAVGFSMGGNIVCKYLGEKPENRQQFVAAISVCQGYDIKRALDAISTWTFLGKAYIRAVSVCVEKILRNFQDVLLADEVLEKHNIQKREHVTSCANLIDLDNVLLSKMAGYTDNSEYYEESSSAHFIPQIDIPILFINARDDPLIPDIVLDIPRKHTEINNRAMFVSTKHGGHLGFFECQQGHRFFHRGTYTWLDKAIVEYIQAVLRVVAVTALSTASEQTFGDEPRPGNEAEDTTPLDEDEETIPLNSGHVTVEHHVEPVVFE